MARPEVSVFEPVLTVAGGTCVAVFDVSASADTPVEFIDVRLRGRQGWGVGSGKSRREHAVLYPELVQRVMGEGTLTAGAPTRFIASFVLPADLPPSHERHPAHARLDVRVHVSLPWRLDRRHEVAFAVRLPPTPMRRTGQIARSTPASAPAGEPRIDLGVTSTQLAAGEMLTGTVAVFHVDDRRSREVELVLIPTLTLRKGARTLVRRADALAFTLALPPGSAGQSVAFAFPIPPTVTPSFSTYTHDLAWSLTASTGSLFSGGKLSSTLALLLTDAASSALAPPLPPPPALGEARAAMVFGGFATRHGWQVTAPAATERTTQVVREATGCVLRLAHVYRGEAGSFLVATVAHPWLGLGLSIGPSSRARHLFFRDIEVDIAAWDRAHHVVARSEAQALPLLRQVVPALMRAGGLGPLVRWTDDELVHERPIDDASEEHLAAAAADLEALAEAITAALPTISPPTDLVIDVEAWRALARALAGTLALGDLTVEGRLDTLPVSLGLERSAAGRPTAIQIEVGAPDLVGADVRASAFVLHRPNSDVLATEATEALVELLTRWPDDVRDLQVAQGVASARLVLPPDEVPAVDAARVRTLADGLRAVLRALETAAGPYR